MLLLHQQVFVPPQDITPLWKAPSLPLVIVGLVLTDLRGQVVWCSYACPRQLHCAGEENLYTHTHTHLHSYLCGAIHSFLWTKH